MNVSAVGTVGGEGRPRVERWGSERLDDLTTLCASALPDEVLLAEDLEATCFDDPPVEPDNGRCGPSVTFGVDDDDGPVGAVAVAIRHFGELTTAHLQVLAVDPRQRRHGVGRALVDTAADYAREAGAALLHAGAGAPFYLFTGVDSRWTDALCFFESLGWERTGAELDLFCATRRTPVPLPAGVGVHPVRTRSELDDVVAFARRWYPHWEAELARGGEGGTVVVARDDEGNVIGAAAHSVNRVGVVGPVAVEPQRRTGGIGTALMGAVLEELSVAGIQVAEIQWTSTVRFYAVACGATVGRASLQLLRRL